MTTSTQWSNRHAFVANDIDVRQYREGTLAIDIFDARTHQPVWSGRARKQLSSYDMDVPHESIREAATAVLAAFPPT